MCEHVHTCVLCVCVCVCRRSGDSGSKVALKLSVPEAKVVASSLEEMEVEEGEESVKAERLSR